MGKKKYLLGKDGTGLPRIKKFIVDCKDKGLTPETIWYANDVGTNDEAKKQLTELFDGKVVFDTPKPERLIHRIIHIATDPGDWVLDSFAGSGTTGSVAHKMQRKWIMVELGPHCDSVIVPRIRKVCDADDPFGVSKSTNWKGGGGFHYHHFGP